MTMSTPADPSPPALPTSAGEPFARDGVFVAGTVMGYAAIGAGGLAALLALIPVVGFFAFPFAMFGLFWGGIGWMMLSVGRRGSPAVPRLGVMIAGGSLALAVVTNVIFLVLLSSS